MRAVLIHSFIHSVIHSSASRLVCSLMSFILGCYSWVARTHSDVRTCDLDACWLLLNCAPQLQPRATRGHLRKAAHVRTAQQHPAGADAGQASAEAAQYAAGRERYALDKPRPPSRARRKASWRARPCSASSSPGGPRSCCCVRQMPASWALAYPADSEGCRVRIKCYVVKCVRQDVVRQLDAGGHVLVVLQTVVPAEPT